VGYEEIRSLTEELMDKIEELKDYGYQKIEILEEEERETLSHKHYNEVVVHKFEKLEKKPKNPFDTLYRRFVKYTSRIPIVGDYVEAFTHSLIKLGVDLLVNPLTFNIKITGRENILKAKPAIVCSNHESFLDIAIYGLKLVPNELLHYYGYLFPSQNHEVNEKIWFMMKRELAQIPILSSWTLSAAGFPIRRGESDKDAIFISKQLLKANRNVVVFPQQTTYPSIDVDSGKTGAIRLAIETGRPIVPISIKGSHDAMKTGIWHLLFPPKAFPVEVNIGEPIYYDKYQSQELTHEDFKDLTRELMIKIKNLQDGIEVPKFNPKYDGDATKPLIARVLAGIGKLFGFPRVDLQQTIKNNPISNALNKITDSAGITSTDRVEGKPKQFAKLSPIDSTLQKLKKRGEKLGLFPWLDKVFYGIAKNGVELLVNGLYDFKVIDRDKIPLNHETGVIFLAMSKTNLDLIFGNALIPEQVHFMIDKKTYEKPVLSTILQSLGFFRKTESPDDFGPLLDLKWKLKDKRFIGIFPSPGSKEKVVRTIAGVIKLAIEGKPTVIVPCAISGTDTPFPPVKVRFVIGDPIPIKRMKKEARYTLAEEISYILKGLQQRAFEARYNT
jgi:1-acyl-sn-glycerol-3-phosphate acyltransferase